MWATRGTSFGLVVFSVGDALSWNVILSEKWNFALSMIAGGGGMVALVASLVSLGALIGLSRGLLRLAALMDSSAQASAMVEPERRT
jgi:hypothetical protein